jgi:hypothetical protein
MAKKKASPRTGSVTPKGQAARTRTVLKAELKPAARARTIVRKRKAPGETTEPTDVNVDAGPKTQGRPKLDAVPDLVDTRDWLYQPRLNSLPDILINCDAVPEILDQGQEGACTGFALAAVINYLLHQRNLQRRASERMLYEMARKYDEWPGEDYEGSSARGAMKGWLAHGVCRRELWPQTQHGVGGFDEALAQDALGTPGGAYYRLMHRQVRDMHSALHETGILYMTLMVHDGWFAPGPDVYTCTYVENNNLHEDRKFPVIRRQGRAASGHAVAIVGYTQSGFIIQNSWGKTWGADGFALLPYEDFLMHATDVWVAQLGVPVRANLWKLGAAETTAGLQRAMPSVPLAEIRPYVIDIGNNGRLSESGKYWTTPADVERLFEKTIPEKTASWPRKRIMIFLHGGLNEEDDVARRIIAFRDVCIANQIYPLHIMWETGWKTTIANIISDRVGGGGERAGNILDRIRGGLGEARDWSFEHTVSLPGTALWDEMKQNARDASAGNDGGVKLIVKYVEAALSKLPAADRGLWEIHLVGHSAGSIFAAYAVHPLLEIGVPVRTVQFMAPAIPVELFKATMLEPITSGAIPHPTCYILSDELEKGDTVSVYGKSLLYLVSNAFERERGKPVLGMERFVRRLPGDGNKPDPEVAALLAGKVDGRPSLVVAGQPGDGASVSTSTTHGGFDNDAPTLNSVLCRILDRKGPDKLTRAFDARDLAYG